jgi:hypothetical protein
LAKSLYTVQQLKFVTAPFLGFAASTAHNREAVLGVIFFHHPQHSPTDGHSLAGKKKLVTDLLQRSKLLAIAVRYAKIVATAETLVNHPIFQATLN